jgi:predicted lipid-binding transport protein (Tim44 family)
VALIWARSVGPDVIQDRILPVQFQILIFAGIAAVVLFQLYNVLGKKVGRQPQEDARAPALPAAEAPTVRPALDAITLAAISGLRARDPQFDPQKFLDGARQAYETIVRGTPPATGRR